MSEIRCNRCQAKWNEENIRRSKFHGAGAARVTTWHTCPECGQTDNHWVYASDIMPEFTGTPGQIKRQQRDWLDEN